MNAGLGGFGFLFPSLPGEAGGSVCPTHCPFPLDGLVQGQDWVFAISKCILVHTLSYVFQFILVFLSADFIVLFSVVLELG